MSKVAGECKSYKIAFFVCFNQIKWVFLKPILHMKAINGHIKYLFVVFFFSYLTSGWSHFILRSKSRYYKPLNMTFVSIKS